MSRSAIQPRCKGQGSPMVARRMGRHVTGRAVLAQSRDRIGGAAELEGAGALQVFAFAEQSAAENGIQSGVVDDGRDPTLRPNPRVREMDVGGVGDG